MMKISCVNGDGNRTRSRILGRLNADHAMKFYISLFFWCGIGGVPAI